MSQKHGHLSQFKIYTSLIFAGLLPYSVLRYLFFTVQCIMTQLSFDIFEKVGQAATVSSTMPVLYYSTSYYGLRGRRAQQEEVGQTGK